MHPWQRNGVAALTVLAALALSSCSYSSSESSSSDSLAFSLCAERGPDDAVRVSVAEVELLDGCQVVGSGYAGVRISGSDRLIASSGARSTEMIRERQALIYEARFGSTEALQPVALDVALRRADGRETVVVADGFTVPAVPSLALSAESVGTDDIVVATWTAASIDAPVEARLQADLSACQGGSADIQGFSVEVDAFAGQAEVRIGDALQALPPDAMRCDFTVSLLFTLRARRDPGFSYGSSTLEARVRSNMIAVTALGPFAGGVR